VSPGDCSHRTAAPTMATAIPTPAPTDPNLCESIYCSADCTDLNAAISGAGCGWDLETNRCASGFTTSQTEVDAMLEADGQQGACSQYSGSPTQAPTAAQGQSTAAPSAGPTPIRSELVVTLQGAGGPVSDAVAYSSLMESITTELVLRFSTNWQFETPFPVSDTADITAVFSASTFTVTFLGTGLAAPLTQALFIDGTEITAVYELTQIIYDVATEKGQLTTPQLAVTEDPVTVTLDGVNLLATHSTSSPTASPAQATDVDAGIEGTDQTSGIDGSNSDDSRDDDFWSDTTLLIYIFGGGGGACLLAIIVFCACKRCEREHVFSPDTQLGHGSKHAGNGNMGHEHELQPVQVPYVDGAFDAENVDNYTTPVQSRGGVHSLDETSFSLRSRDPGYTMA